MKRVRKILKEMEDAPQNVRFSSLARQRGTSHHVYKTPWLGDPRVNIQLGRNGKAKPYQVKQVLAAIRRLENE